jgi:hypothetical protein
MTGLKEIFGLHNKTKESDSHQTTTAGGEAFLDAGLTDMEAGPESPASKPSAKARKEEYLKNKGKAPYELESLSGFK